MSLGAWQNNRKSVGLAAALIAGLVIFRGRAIFTPFSDPTVGLYLHIAQSWLDGHVPYTAAWDYRPPGYFAMYAVATQIFGAAAARDILAVVALAATTVAVALIAIRIDPLKETASGAWAAVFFVLLSPVNDAIAGVAELQINAFLAWAIYASLSDRRTMVKAILSGLLAGLALQCKLSALPLLIVPGALLSQSSQWPALLTLFLGGIGFPVVLEIALYANVHELRALWNANVGATLRRAQGGSASDEFSRNRIQFLRQFWTLAPQIELATFALSRKTNRSLTASAGWLAASVISIVLAGEYYERQFVLLTAPIALLGALGFKALLRELKWKGRNGRALAALVVILTFALHDYFETMQSAAYFLHRVALRQSDWRLDASSQIREILQCLAPSGSSLYVIEQSPYLYDLLNVPSPTVYAYSDHLLDPRLSLMAGIDGKAELSRILKTQPHYVVISRLADFRYAPDRVQLIRRTLERSYRLAYSGKGFSIYELSSDSEANDSSRLQHTCEKNAL